MVEGRDTDWREAAVVAAKHCGLLSTRGLLAARSIPSCSLSCLGCSRLPVPAAAEGASDTFKGTAIHRLVKDMGAFGGKSSRWAPRRSGCAEGASAEGGSC